MSIINTVKNNKLKTFMIFILGFVLLLMLFMYSNKVAPVAWGLYGDVNSDAGVAIQGGDVVAYYTEGKFVKGSPTISYKGKNAIWLFSSEANKNLFISSPEKYMPQYGGYCAFAVSKGVTANVKPEFWTIQNNKLYIFNDAGVKDEWIDGIDTGSLTTSDENWSTRI